MNADEHLHFGTARAGRGRSLRTYVILVAIVLAVLPAAISGVSQAWLSSHVIRDENLRRMNAIAGGKAGLLESIVTDWCDSMDAFVRRPRVRQLAAAVVSDGPAVAAARMELHSRAAVAFDLGHGEGRLVLVSLRTGKPLLWWGYETSGEVATAAAEYTTGFMRTLRGAWMSPAHGPVEYGSAVVDLIDVFPTPSEGAAGEPAALIWKINLGRELFTYVQPRGEMGASGELVIVNQSGLALQEFGGEPKAVLRETINTEPVRRALAGVPGAFIARDYRGVLVFAGYRRMPSTGWGIVAKMDASEAYGSLPYWSMAWALLTVLVIAGGIALANVLGARLVRPVVDMATAALQVAAGDLQVRLSAQRTDELGQLAGTFNDMVAKVSQTQATLEQQVRERTAQLETNQKRLRALAGDLATIQQRERQRLASVIHDELAQTLGGLKLYLQNLHIKPEAGPVAQELAEAIGITDEAVHQSRMVIMELSPPILQQEGLLGALQWWAGQLQEKHGLQVTVNAPDGLRRFDSDIEGAVFQAVKELLQNTVKYAHVTSAEVKIECHNSFLSVEVADKGAGFDPAAVEVTDQGGFGLFSIRERVTYMGGSFAVVSAPGQGTRSTISLPVHCQEVQPAEGSVAEAEGETTKHSPQGND